MEKTRLEAFSDGVFAIIITIMVLELKVPHRGELKDLAPLIPTLLSYVQSFLIVSNYWVNHHHLLYTSKKTNGRMLLANLFLLFTLSLIPFATSWVGETEFATIPVIVYALLLLSCGIAYTILQRTIRQANVWGDKINNAMKHGEKKNAFSVAMYIAAITIAFYNPLISEVMFLIVSLTWLVPDRNIEQAFSE